MRREPSDVLAAEPHEAILRRVDARDQVEQCGLTGPIRTNDRENESGRYGEADLTDGAHAAEGGRFLRKL
jgi:hypothetical protein